MVEGTTPVDDRLRAAQAGWTRQWYREGHYRGCSFASTVAGAMARSGRTPLTFHGTARRPATVTVADLAIRSRRVAANLLALGLRPGDAVCVQVPNGVENSLVCLAALQAGLVLVPVVTISGEAELRFIVGQTEARALVIGAGQVELTTRVSAVRTEVDLPLVVVIGEDVPSDAFVWDDVEREPAGGTAPLPGRRPDETCLVIYTSGTTGVPKGVRHTTNGLLASASSGPPVFSAETQPVSLFASPSGHIGGVLGVLFPFLTGVPGVYLDRWSAERAAALVAEHRITRSTGAPLHLLGLVEIAERGELDMSSFWYHCCGGAPVPPATIERAALLGWRPARSYGSSEHPSSTAGHDADPLAVRALTDGSPAPGVRVRVVDERGNDVPAGSDGEVLNVGPKLFAGYVDAALDAEHFTPDGWFRTGDVGHLDGSGRLTITDRKKDLIIRGGENISPREVEEVLGRHPAIVEAAVVSAPDPRYGERV